MMAILPHPTVGLGRASKSSLELVNMTNMYIFSPNTIAFPFVQSRYKEYPRLKEAFLKVWFSWFCHSAVGSPVWQKTLVLRNGT